MNSPFVDELVNGEERLNKASTASPQTKPSRRRRLNGKMTGTYSLPALPYAYDVSDSPVPFPRPLFKTSMPLLVPRARLVLFSMTES